MGVLAKDTVSRHADDLAAMNPARMPRTISQARETARLLVVLRRARRFLAVDVPVIPREVALVAIADVARARDAVELVRVNHQLCVDAEAAQRLIHLLPALHRHVEIALAAEYKRRRLDSVGVQERIRQLLVGLPRLRIPRRADLVVVLDDVLIRAVEGDGERRAGAA